MELTNSNSNQYVMYVNSLVFPLKFSDQCLFVRFVFIMTIHLIEVKLLYFLLSYIHNPIDIQVIL